MLVFIWILYPYLIFQWLEIKGINPNDNNKDLHIQTKQVLFCCRVVSRLFWMAENCQRGKEPVIYPINDMIVKILYIINPLENYVKISY